MGIKQVEVAKGLIIKVKRGINAADNVTGRVDGKTYEGKTWADVERKIRADYADRREWAKYIVIYADLPDADRRFACSYNGRYPNRAVELSFNYSILEATQAVHNDGEIGIFSRATKHERPRFHRGSKDAVDALSLGDSTAVLVWSEALEHQVMALCDAVDEMAMRIGALLMSQDLAKVLMGGKVSLALAPASIEEGCSLAYHDSAKCPGGGTE